MSFIRRHLIRISGFNTHTPDKTECLYTKTPDKTECLLPPTPDKTECLLHPGTWQDLVSFMCRRQTRFTVFYFQSHHTNRETSDKTFCSTHQTRHIYLSFTVIHTSDQTDALYTVFYTQTSDKTYCLSHNPDVWTDLLLLFTPKHLTRLVCEHIAHAPYKAYCLFNRLSFTS